MSEAPCPLCQGDLEPASVQVVDDTATAEGRLLSARITRVCQHCDLEFTRRVRYSVRERPRLAVDPALMTVRERELRDRHLDLRDRRSRIRSVLDDLVRREENGQLGVDAATGKSIARTQTELNLSAIEINLQQVAAELQEIEAVRMGALQRSGE